MRRIYAALFSLLLLTPLVTAPGFGYDALRLPAALTLVTLLLALSVVRIARRGEGEACRDPLFTAACLLAAIHAVSFLGRGPSWEGAMPLLVLFTGVASYRIARSGSLHRDWVRSTVPWILAALGLAFAAFGLIQKAMGQPAVSTEGNTNYSGTLAAMLLPPAFAFAFIRKDPWKRGGMIAAVIALLALLLATESRGGWIGAGVGMAVAVAGLAWGRVPGTRKAVVAAIIGIIILPIVLQGREHLSARRVETAGVRLEIWKSTLRMIADHPWIGTGPGRFAAEYPPYRSLEEFRLSHKYAGPDFKEVEDAHSSWVQGAAETGIPGLIAFLLVVYVSARLWLYSVKSAEDGNLAALLAGLGGGAAAYLVAGLFNTLTLHLSHTVLFWAFLGMIECAGLPRRRRPTSQLSLALPAGAAVAAMFAAWMGVMLARADGVFFSGMAQSDPTTRAAFLERAFPPSWNLSYELGRAYEKAGRFPEAAEAYQTSLIRRPHHVPALNNLAIALLRSGAPEEVVGQRLRRATEVAPFYFLSWHNLGLLELRNLRYGEAEALFSRAAELNDRHAGSAFSLGEARLLQEDFPGALAPLRKARDLGFDVGVNLRRDHPAQASDPRLAEFFR
jgi:O-antigen ligase